VSVAIVLLSCAAAWADVLELRTGERVEGELDRGTAESISMKVGPTKLSFKRTEVRAFYFGSAPPDLEKLERIAKAEADLRTLASAVSIYSAFTGQLPENLAELASPVTNAQAQTAGPFLLSVPSPPCGWSEYTLVEGSGGTFRISAQGDGVTLSAP